MSPARIGVFGTILIFFRLTLLFVALLGCVPFYYLFRWLRLRQVWPRIFLGSVAAIAGLRIGIIGQRRRGALLLSNHVSWMDIPALARVSGSAFVAHDGLAQNGILKRLCEMNETVFIARHRRTDVQGQIGQIRDALRETGALTLFPEGTTGDGVTLLPFKSSLLSAIDPLPPGIAVQPVLLSYAEAPDIAWLGEEPGIDNFMRIMARWRPVDLTIHFLSPLEGEALAGRKAMAAAAHGAIAGAMGLA